MVNASEKHRLLEAYRDPAYARTAVARAVAGLTIVAVVALIGDSYSVEREGPPELRSQQAASGR